MRKVAEIVEEASAKLFSDYLTSEGIGNQIDDGGDGLWFVWVHRDSQLDEAKDAFQAFTVDPTAEKYLLGQKSVQEQHRKKQVLDAKIEKQRREYEKAQEVSSPGMGFFTSSILVLTLAVAVWTGLGMSADYLPRILMLQMSETENLFLPEVQSGEVWRVLTPAFLHFGVMHLVFNLIGFAYLGQMIERNNGTIFLVVLFVLSGVVSNFSEYMVTGPTFGGLSGIDYALFGFVWMKTRFDPFSGYFLSESTVVFAMIWLVLCFTNMMGNIANIAHLSGLLFGLILGFLVSKVFR